MENEIIDSSSAKASEDKSSSVEDIANKETAHEEIVHHETVEPTAAENIVDKPKKPSWFKKFFTLKKIIIIVIVIVVLGAAYYFKGLVIAATVNGSVISRFEVINELEKNSGKAALDSIISERLINQEADSKKITVSSDEVKAEFDKIDKQLVAQGTTLDAALAEQNLTRDDLSKRIIVQKKLEKILADKIAVTDQEVDQYIKDNAVTLPKGQETEARASIKDQISSTKLNDEATKLVDELKAKAKILRFVNY